MKFDSREILNKIQTLTNARKSEILFVTVIFLGLSIGALYENFFKEQKINTQDKLINTIDSLNKFSTDTTSKIIIEDSTETEKNYSTQKVLKIGKDLPPESININTAVKHDLMKIPGIGEKSAETIIEYRKNNPFLKKEDIMNIKGIGEKKYEKIKEIISVK